MDSISVPTPRAMRLPSVHRHAHYEPVIVHHGSKSTKSIPVTPPTKLTREPLGDQTELPSRGEHSGAQLASELHREHRVAARVATGVAAHCSLGHFS